MIYMRRFIRFLMYQKLDVSEVTVNKECPPAYEIRSDPSASSSANSKCTTATEPVYPISPSAVPVAPAARKVSTRECSWTAKVQRSARHPPPKGCRPGYRIGTPPRTRRRRRRRRSRRRWPRHVSHRSPRGRRTQRAAKSAAHRASRAPDTRAKSRVDFAECRRHKVPSSPTHIWLCCCIM